jgi:hypothetical protein
MPPVWQPQLAVKIGWIAVGKSHCAGGGGSPVVVPSEVALVGLVGPPLGSGVVVASEVEVVPVVGSGSPVVDVPPVLEPPPVLERPLELALSVPPSGTWYTVQASEIAKASGKS